MQLPPCPCACSAAAHVCAALLRLTEPDAGQQQGGLDASACSAIEECLETLVEVLHQVVPEAAHLLKHDASVVKCVELQRALLVADSAAASTLSGVCC